jgi:hypothetical protein
MGRLYRKIPLKRLPSGRVFRDCSHFFMFRPPILLATLVAPTTTVSCGAVRGFYIRAERASLPPHAPNMLAVCIQVIDSTGTFTLQVPQPCRLLLSGHPHHPALPNHIHRFDPLQCAPRRRERAVALRQPGSLLYRAVVPFHYRKYRRQLLHDGRMEPVKASSPPTVPKLWFHCENHFCTVLRTVSCCRSPINSAFGENHKT